MKNLFLFIALICSLSASAQVTRRQIERTKDSFKVYRSNFYACVKCKDTVIAQDTLGRISVIKFSSPANQTNWDNFIFYGKRLDSLKKLNLKDPYNFIR